MSVDFTMRVDECRITVDLQPPFLEKYNPDQERDEHGRWTSGSGASASGEVPANTGASDRASQVKAAVMAQLQTLGMERYPVVFENSANPTDKTVTSDLNKGMEGLGPGWKTAAYFKPDTARLRGTENRYTKASGSIHFFTDVMRPETAAQTARHEALHARFHFADMKSATMQTFMLRNAAALQKEDGTTEYSRAHWGRVRPAGAVESLGSQNMRIHTAVNESLAEMHATHSMTPTYAKLNALVEKQWAKRKT